MMALICFEPLADEDDVICKDTILTNAFRALLAMSAPVEEAGILLR